MIGEGIIKGENARGNEAGSFYLARFNVYYSGLICVCVCESFCEFRNGFCKVFTLPACIDLREMVQKGD